MAAQIGRGPNLHYFDYWFVLEKVMRPDGGLRIEGILQFRNEHPLFVPSLIYWVNGRYMGASNHMLGYLTLALAALAAVLGAWGLSRRIRPPERAVVLFAIACLVFSLGGIHNFVFGMSGVAWWSANLAAVFAILLAARGRFVAANGAALIGACCYGTAFAIGPAVVALAVVRRERTAAIVGSVLASASVIIGWVALSDSRAGPGAETANPVTWLRTTLATLGAVWTHDNMNLAAIAGLLVGVGACAAGLADFRDVRQASALGALSDEQERALARCGLVIYAAAAASIVGLARGELGAAPALASRYASLSALFTAGCLLILISSEALAMSRPLRLAICGVVASAALLVGTASTDETKKLYPSQQLLAIGLHIDAVSAVKLGTAIEFPPTARERLVAVQGYPMTSNFSLGCDDMRFGDVFDVAPIQVLPATTNIDREGNGPTIARLLRRVAADGAVRIDALAALPGTAVECALVTDHDDVVVGAGVVSSITIAGSPNGRVSSSITAVARFRDADESGVLALRAEDGRWYGVQVP